MKIALVYPSKHSDEQQMPLGIGYLASFVLSRNKDVEVRALDTGISTQKELSDFLRQPHDAVGITVTSRTYPEAIELAKKFSQNSANVPIIFGGPHISIVMQKIMEDPVVELAIYGEGEFTFNELLGLLREPGVRFKPEALSKVNGLIFRNGNNVVVNPPRAMIEELDALPFPAFHLFPMKRYTGKLPMITSRGCPFSCVYCASSKIWGRKWRARSPQNVIAEVKYMLRQFGTIPIDFHDAAFNMNLERVNGICDQFITNGITVPWGVRGFRADIINPEIAKKMRKAGCSHVAIGIESANPQMLIRMGKRETIEQITGGIKTLRSAGIDVIGQFMIGNPGETLETVKESIEFARNSGLTKAAFGTAVPFPGTGLWEYVEQCGKFLVEPDCTRFEEMYPRIIFETPGFNAEQRLQAIKMAENAGLMDSGERKSSLTRKLFEKLVFRCLFKFMPAKLSVRIYFLLRKLRSKLHGAG